MENEQQGQLYLLGSRGYSAYEVAQQNGYTGTEEEWLASLKGDKGDPGTPFDELTPEQKAEIKGDRGYSAYEVAQQNGFIGTEEEWVNAFLTPDGYYNKDEIDIKINKKPNYYNSIASMKADTTLKNGDMAITLGYYNANDGGGATYVIKDSATEDGYFIHKLTNNKYAELVVENNKVNIKQIGGNTTDDIHDLVLAIINKNYECFIPQGIWKTTPIQISKYNSTRISGQSLFAANNSTGTMLQPMANQDYILKIGYSNTSSVCTDVTIKNIEFSTGNYTCVNALILYRVGYSNFNELSFRKCTCSNSALKITELWESRIGRILFRVIDCPYALIFGSKQGTGNISTDYFEYLSFEGCRGNCIKFEEDSGYSMNTIDTIDFESGVVAFDDETRDNITTVDSYDSLCVIETGDGYGEISINNFNVNAIAQYVYINNTTEEARGFDTLIKCNNTDTGYYSFAIGNICGAGNVVKPILINANSIDKFYCNNYIFRGGTYFNCIVENGCRVFKYLPSKFIDNYINSNLDEGNRDLYIDDLRPYCKSASEADRAVRVATLTRTGSKLYVHAKGTGNINYGGSDHVTLSSVADYGWFAITMSAAALNSNNNLLLGSNTELEIDDYYFGE